MSDPLDAVATAADIAAGVRTGAVSARAVVEAALARIEQGNRAINAFTAIAAARALEQAKRIDTERRAGTPLGELAGVPFGVKAMIDVAGLTTTGGSALYRNAGAATRDAVVVRKLEAAGAVCVGALNMDEFGMGGTTENACFGPTRNPHDLARTPGGSSGGSAAAVAAGMVPITIGSDGLGSIRLPPRCAACSDCVRREVPSAMGACSAQAVRSPRWDRSRAAVATLRSAIAQCARNAKISSRRQPRPTRRSDWQQRAAIFAIRSMTTRPKRCGG